MCKTRKMKNAIDTGQVQIPRTFDNLFGKLNNYVLVPFFYSIGGWFVLSRGTELPVWAGVLTPVVANSLLLAHLSS